MAADFTESYVRTERGRLEIKVHAVALTRAGRNLLMVIDGTCSGAKWVGKVHGSTTLDLQQLIDAGLVAPRAGTSAAPSPAPAPAPAPAVAGAVAPKAAAPVAAPAPAAAPASGHAPPPVVSEAALAAGLEKWSYDGLYTLLTHEAKERFGLIKGYRLILEIERCANIAELRTVALRFVEHIRTAHGEDSAARFRQRLLAGA